MAIPPFDEKSSIDLIHEKINTAKVVVKDGRTFVKLSKDAEFPLEDIWKDFHTRLENEFSSTTPEMPHPINAKWIETFTLLKSLEDKAGNGGKSTEVIQKIQSTFDDEISDPSFRAKWILQKTLHAFRDNKVVTDALSSIDKALDTGNFKAFEPSLLEEAFSSMDLEKKLSFYNDLVDVQEAFSNIFEHVDSSKGAQIEELISKIQDKLEKINKELRPVIIDQIAQELFDEFQKTSKDSTVSEELLKNVDILEISFQFGEEKLAVQLEKGQEKTARKVYQISENIAHGGVKILNKAVAEEGAKEVYARMTLISGHVENVEKELLPEKKIADILKGVPGILHIELVKDVKTGKFSLKMPFIEKGNILEVVLNGSDPLPLDKRLSLAAEAIDTLSQAHKKGVALLDIKPDNIRIDSEGKVKFIDYGLASSLEKGGEITQRGSSGYMAPEMIFSHKETVTPTKEMDSWSLGMTLFEILENDFDFCELEGQLQNLYKQTVPLLSMEKISSSKDGLRQLKDIISTRLPDQYKAGLIDEIIDVKLHENFQKLNDGTGTDVEKLKLMITICADASLVEKEVTDAVLASIERIEPNAVLDGIKKMAHCLYKNKLFDLSYDYRTIINKPTLLSEVQELSSLKELQEKIEKVFLDVLKDKVDDLRGGDPIDKLLGKLLERYPKDRGNLDGIHKELKNVNIGSLTVPEIEKHCPSYQETSDPETSDPETSDQASDQETSVESDE